MADDRHVSKVLRDNLKQQVAKETDDIYQSLVTTKDNHQIPEALFVNYFLPHFSGQYALARQTQVIADWISIAGTAMHEVDVINLAGEVLFTVPSLFDTTTIDSLQREVGNSLADIYNEYDLQGNNIPMIAEAFLDRELSKKVAIVKESPHAQDTLARWFEIFKRYGIATTVPQAPLVDDPTDDLEY